MVTPAAAVRCSNARTARDQLAASRGSAPVPQPPAYQGGTGRQPVPDPAPVNVRRAGTAPAPAPFSRAAKGSTMLNVQTVLMFCLSDAVYYESPDRLADESTWYAQTAQPAPAGWRRSAHGLWTQLRPEA